jgi:hypothetical protein
MNLDRCIEQLLLNYKVDLAPMGHIFADKLIDSLSNSPNVKVNTNKVEFLAYDGRNVEFDFIGTFDDYLLLFEFKSITIPYSDKEFFVKERTIKEGVEQVNRRCCIVHNDWDKIINLVNIVYSFKIFYDPYIGVIKCERSTQSVQHAEHPTVSEFIAYLESPVTTSFIHKCFEEVENIQPCFEEDIPIAFCELSLKEDPFKKIIETKIAPKKKAGRNEACPCNSGKKYKKCCGK